MLLYCLPLLLILTAETAMAYIFPILVVDSGLTNTQLGLILGLSAFTAICFDFLLPILLKNKSWRFQFILGISLAFLFPLLTSLSIAIKIPFFFLLASLFWYIYYELLLFSQQNFVVSQTKNHNYSHDWGIIFLITQISWIIGPIISAVLLEKSSFVAINAVIIITFLSLLVSLFTLKKIKGIKNINTTENFTINFSALAQFNLYKTYLKPLFPVMVLAFTINFLGEMFWNMGGLLGQTEQTHPGLSWLIINMYCLPLLIGPLVLTKIKINHHKKKLAIVGLLLSGITLSFLMAANSFVTILIIIFLTGVFISFSSPLNEAVFSDLLSRSPQSKIYLLSLIRIIYSVSCMFSPIITGFLADQLGYKSMFGTMGIAATLIAIMLLISTPLKIKLPQNKIKSLLQS
jgi:predicted MFS family arabinose efflux permease